MKRILRLINYYFKILFIFKINIIDIAIKIIKIIINKLIKIYLENEDNKRKN